MPQSPPSFASGLAVGAYPPVLTTTEGGLPGKLAIMAHEVRWILVAVFCAYLALILWGYSPQDPGWSQTSLTGQIRNPGGWLGAWLADFLFVLLGRSSWWCVAFLLYLIVWGYRRLAGWLSTERRPLYLAVIGFLGVLFASAGIEGLRFWSSPPSAHIHAGGIIGLELARFFSTYLGFLGGTLILLGLWAAGLSLCTGLSWLGLAERIGIGLELTLKKGQQLKTSWQDRRIGREVAERREVVVEQALKRLETAPPVVIAPVEATVPVAKKAVERAEKERQTPLFFDTPDHALPPLHLLDPAEHRPDDSPSAEVLEFTSRLIERKLADFGVEIKVLSAHPGPVVTRFEIEPSVGIKGATIVGLAKDLARALSLMSIRVVETVPGKSCMALELPNAKRQTVRLTEIIGSEIYNRSLSLLTVTLGKDIAGQPVVADLAKMPHLLVAGTTGSGKSVGVNAMILSLLYKATPSQLRLIMIDPKMLELSIYEGIPHLLAPVVTDMTKAANALNWSVGEMERRYKLLSALGVRNLAGYNSKILESQKNGSPLTNPFSLTPQAPEPLDTLPCIVIIIDELADLMMVVGKKVEELIARLAQKARAAGIHLIVATQRPSVDVITGLIKANIPTRIAFQVSSKIDSRTILDQMGAEALLGQGDMLYLAPGTGLPQRVHGAFVSDDEVHHVVDYLKKTAPADYVEAVLGSPTSESDEPGLCAQGSANAEADALYDQAVEIVLKTRRPSISLVQRHLRIGYNRAARLIEAMENAGLVSPMNATGNREVLVPDSAGDAG